MPSFEGMHGLQKLSESGLVDNPSWWLDGRLMLERQVGAGEASCSLQEAAELEPHEDEREATA